MAERGRFITFEGPEGSGKTTQAERLCAALRAKGIEVLLLREPGGTATGEAIRNILQHDAAGEPICAEAEALLFAASRAQLVRARIIPALEAGCWVVCDRFADSTTAYQGYGRGFGAARMQSINAFAIDGATPDQTFLIDVDEATTEARLRVRHTSSGGGPDRIERESDSFHRKVRDGYLELAAAEPNRFVVIDGTRDEETVAQEVWSHVEPALHP